MAAASKGKPFWAANNNDWTEANLVKSSAAGLAAGKKKLPSMKPISSDMTTTEVGKMTSLPSSFKMILHKNTPFYRVAVGGEDPSAYNNYGRNGAKTLQSTSFRKNQQLWELAKGNGQGFVTDDSNVLTDPNTGEIKGHRIPFGKSAGGGSHYDIHLGHTAENCPDNKTS
jgi:hypothetical protein